jgi:hypothetical protein
MKWNGYKAALSLTFDDGLTCQLDHAIPAMDTAHIKGTFFLPTDTPQYPLDLPRWKEAMHSGHEIGSHSVSHRKAAGLNEADCLREASGSRKYLQEVFATRVPSFCYPYTDAPPLLQSAVKAAYRQARGGRIAREDKILIPGDGANLYNIPCHHVSRKCFELNEIFPWIDETISRGGWLTLMLHGVGPDMSQWDNVPSPEFEALLGRLSYFRGKGLLWAAPFGLCAEAYRNGK